MYTCTYIYIYVCIYIKLRVFNEDKCDKACCRTFLCCKTFLCRRTTQIVTKTMESRFSTSARRIELQKDAADLSLLCYIHIYDFFIKCIYVYRQVYTRITCTRENQIYEGMLHLFGCVHIHKDQYICIYT